MGDWFAGVQKVRRDRSIAVPADEGWDLRGGVRRGFEMEIPPCYRDTYVPRIFFGESDTRLSRQILLFERGVCVCVCVRSQIYCGIGNGGPEQSAFYSVRVSDLVKIDVTEG